MSFYVLNIHGLFIVLDMAVAVTTQERADPGAAELYKSQSWTGFG